MHSKTVHSKTVRLQLRETFPTDLLRAEPACDNHVYQMTGFIFLGAILTASLLLVAIWLLNISYHAFKEKIKYGWCTLFLALFCLALVVDIWLGPESAPALYEMKKTKELLRTLPPMFRL